MGTFSVGCKIENSVDRTRHVKLPRMLVDTGSEYTWAPATALEKIGITRSVGFAIIRVDKALTIDEVVFAEKGDLLLLGARSLEGLCLTVDSRRKKPEAAGPLLAATALRARDAALEPSGLPCRRRTQGWCDQRRSAARRMDRAYGGGVHSITRSALINNACGIFSPSAFAVLPLMTNSILVGCSTGRSAGFAPLKIRST